MPDVGPPPFTPIWNQEVPPPMVSYPELMGFPCSDLGNLLIYLIKLAKSKKIFLNNYLFASFVALWPRSQIGGLVGQRHSPRGASLAPNSNGTSSSSAPKKTRRRYEPLNYIEKNTSSLM